MTAKPEKRGTKSRARGKAGAATRHFTAGHGAATHAPLRHGTRYRKSRMSKHWRARRPKNAGRRLRSGPASAAALNRNRWEHLEQDVRHMTATCGWGAFPGKGRRRLMKPVAGSSSCRHACLQEGSCPVLSLRVGGSQSVVPVVGRPVELVTAVSFVNGVLCLIPGGIDECK
jgi:hypothetical protein